MRSLLVRPFDAFSQTTASGCSYLPYMSDRDRSQHYLPMIQRGRQEFEVLKNRWHLLGMAQHVDCQGITLRAQKLRSSMLVPSHVPLEAVLHVPLQRGDSDCFGGVSGESKEAVIVYATLRSAEGLASTQGMRNSP